MAGDISIEEPTTVIYFIHDKTSRTIKIGCAWNPARRLSTLQISTSHELILLGAIAGMKKTEKQVHELVGKHCVQKSEEPHVRPLCVQGEWFDDRILPFVIKLMDSPGQYLGTSKKQTARPSLANRDPLLHQCRIVMVFDSGETFHERYILKAASPAQAMSALSGIAHARLHFLANTARITRLAAPGCPTKKVSLQGAFVTQRCEPREGLSVIFNSEPGNGYMTMVGVKHYSDRWFHGVPDELCDLRHPWSACPTDQFEVMLHQFAAVLTSNQCVISTSNPLLVRGLIPRHLCRLPRGELRSKANQKAMIKKRQKRLPGVNSSPKDGIVYFIQDRSTLDIKIGFCLKNPEKRLAALQTGNANVLHLLGHVVGSSFHEKALHMRFSSFHLKGEWFSPCIAEALDRILTCASVADWLNAQAPALSQPEVDAKNGGSCSSFSNDTSPSSS